MEDTAEAQATANVRFSVMMILFSCAMDILTF